MSQNEATTTRLPDSPVSIYERFTSLYDLMFRFNGYARSIERYLRENPLPLAAGARVLDAGCGTGLLTLSLLRVLKRPAEITAVDLSGRSLQTARRAVRKHADDPRHKISFVRANALSLPFPDDSFDLVVTSPAATSSSSPSALRPRRACSKSCSASRRTRPAPSPRTPNASSASSKTTASPRTNPSAGRRASCWHRSRRSRKP